MESIKILKKNYVNVVISAELVYCMYVRFYVIISGWALFVFMGPVKLSALCDFRQASLCTWFDNNDKRIVTLSDLVRRKRFFTIICIYIYAYCNVYVLDLIYIHIFNLDTTITLYLENLRTSIYKVDFIHGTLLTHF